MIALLVVLGAVALFVFWGVAIYNGLVSRRQGVKNAWSQIDVQLKRRYDLIPNLVETVKGYMAHEREVLGRVTEARAMAMKTAQGGNVKEVSAAEGALSKALAQVYAVMENYPDLKANQNAMQLQEELVSTENRISFARQHYNNSVEILNTSIQKIPNNIVAGMGGFQVADFFELEAPAEERKAPKVQF